MGSSSGVSHAIHSANVNVETYLHSELDADSALEFGFEHIVVATGSRWRRDGIARYHQQPIPGLDTVPTLTPDDIVNGDRGDGVYLIYDDDHYYMGSVIAELLAGEGHEVIFVTPAGLVSSWSTATLDQHRIHKTVLEVSRSVHVNHALCAIESAEAILESVFTGRETRFPIGCVVPVTARLPNDRLYLELGNASLNGPRRRSAPYR